MKQPTSEQAPRAGIIAQQSEAPASTAQQVFGVAPSASAKTHIRKIGTRTTMIRPDVVVTAGPSTSASATASSVFLPPSTLAPPSSHTKKKSPEADEEETEPVAEVPKTAMKYLPFKDAAEEKKAMKKIKQIQKELRDAEGKDYPQDAETTEKLRLDRLWAKFLQTRLDKTEELRKSSGGAAQSTLSPSVEPSASAPRTAGGSSVGAPRVTVRGQRLQEAEKAPQSSDPIMVQEGPKKSKVKDKAQVHAPPPSAGKLKSEIGPTSDRATVSIPGRERSGAGSGPIAATGQGSAQKRLVMSMIGVRTTPAGKAAVSAAGLATGKTSATVPEPLHTNSATSTTVTARTAAAAGSGRSGGSGAGSSAAAGADSSTATWDIRFGVRNPDSLDGLPIPKKAVTSGRSASKSDSSSAARKDGKGKPGAGAGTSAGNGGQSSAVVDMRDADK
ncbi:hypothetical protein CF326_g9712, partial [Tilletia indica]